MRLKQHLPSCSGYFCLYGCPVAMTIVGETTRLTCQTIPVLSTVLPLSGCTDAITRPTTATVSLQKLEMGKIVRAGLCEKACLANTLGPIRSSMDTFDAWAMMADNYSQWENLGETAWLRLAILLYG